MPAEKTDAVILRVVEFSESSCVVTLYTEGFGKISALAKGARRPKSPFDGAIDLLSICRIVFLRKNVEVLDLLTEAKLVRRFRSAATDLHRLYAGMHAIQLVSSLTDHAEPHPSLYRILAQAIESLDSGGPVAETLLQFELSLLAELGHMPALEDCVECGAPVGKAGKNGLVSFGLLNGGVLCPRCRPGKRSVVQIRGETVEAMRHLSGRDREGNIVASDALETGENPMLVCEAGISIPRASRGEIRGLLDQYLANLIGHKPSTSQWLRRVFTE
jgi:DNA repair protein RecO (recombination protein O)